VVVVLMVLEVDVSATGAPGTIPMILEANAVRRPRVTSRNAPRTSATAQTKKVRNILLTYPAAAGRSPFGAEGGRGGSRLRLVARSQRDVTRRGRVATRRASLQCCDVPRASAVRRR
jgi:hypothetical protein